MGAEQFWQRARGKTPNEAFQAAREQAAYDHGHAGYTGTIAEKHEFVVIPFTEIPEDMTPSQYAGKLMEDSDERVDNKWGPAGCIQVGPEEWLFFGWASS